MGCTIDKRINTANNNSNNNCCSSYKIINNEDLHNKKSLFNTIVFLFRTTFKITLRIFFGYYFYIIFISFIPSLAASNLNISEINSGCPSSSDPNCLKCNLDGCMKCPQLLIIDKRECTDQCPSGYLDQWSSNPDYMGRICILKNSIDNATYPTIIGILVGFLLCLIFLVLCIIIIKRKKRRKHIKQILITDNHHNHNHNHHHHLNRCDFLQQLNELRPNAEYILSMLNDTRRQIRKLHLSGETSAAQSYRPLIRDLAKLLILLNRPIELIPAPPHDWNRIYTWAERALEQYKPQIGQLIDFFQGNDTTSVDPRFDTLNKNSTFRSSGGSGGGSSGYGGGGSGYGCGGIGGNNYGCTSAASNLKNSHQMQLFGSLISLHEFDEPTTRCSTTDPFGSSFNTIKNANGNVGICGGSNMMMTNAELNASSLWLEDEFFKLGLRPQDEITTEL